MASEKRIIDGYAAVQSVRIGGSEYIAAEKAAETGVHYRLYQSKRNNPLFIEHQVVFESGDYIKVMRELTRRINAALDVLDLDTVYRGSPNSNAVLTSADCEQGGMSRDLTGKVVAIKAGALSPEYRACSHQLMLATSGFGCSPNASGTAVYCTNLYSGEKARWERYDILGVVSEDTLPAWARDKLAALREPKERESTMAQLQNAKKQPRSEHQRKNGHRHDQEL